MGIEICTCWPRIAERLNHIVHAINFFSPFITCRDRHHPIPYQWCTFREQFKNYSQTIFYSLDLALGKIVDTNQKNNHGCTFYGLIIRYRVDQLSRGLFTYAVINWAVGNRRRGEALGDAIPEKYRGSLRYEGVNVLMDQAHA